RLDREMASVAQAHAMRGLRQASSPGPLLLKERHAERRIPIAPARRHGRRASVVTKAAEQEVEQTLGGGAAGCGQEQRRGEQACREWNSERRARNHEYPRRPV